MPALSRILSYIACTILVFGAAHADSTTEESELIDNVWVNLGMYSIHGKEEVKLNNENFGFGFEYKFAETHSITAGTFKNSDFEQSRYLGWYWLPLQFGPVRLGGILGLIDGYSKARNGNVFPAILPAISYEGERFGINIYPIPGFNNNLYTAISLQLKVRLD